VKVNGYLTKSILSGSMSSNKVSKDLTFCYLNRRPIDMPRKIRQLFSDIYKQFNPSMSPIIIINLEVEDNNYDINVSPDKRDVFLKNEEEVVESMRSKLNEFFEQISRVKAYDSSKLSTTPVQ
jgi:DNA mismatch repair protein PMS2